MKTNILKLTVLLLVLAGIFSCTKKEETIKIEHEAYLEYLDNSFPHLPWLKKIIDEHRNAIEAGGLNHATIHRCRYKDGIGFLLNRCVECMDLGAELIDVEGKFVCSSGGWVNSCREFDIDYKNKKLIWEIQPNPPITIDNLYEQPLAVINKSVQGKWILHKFWGGFGNVHYYDWTTFVYISENCVTITGNESINLTFSYSWKKMKVSPPYPDMAPYSTYVMWNDKQNKGEWSFFQLQADMLEVNLYNSGVYILIRVRDDETSIR